MYIAGEAASADAITSSGKRSIGSGQRISK